MTQPRNFGKQELLERYKANPDDPQVQADITAYLEGWAQRVTEVEAAATKERTEREEFARAVGRAGRAKPRITPM